MREITFIAYTRVAYRRDWSRSLLHSCGEGYDWNWQWDAVALRDYFSPEVSKYVSYYYRKSFYDTR